jgi:hypothetical protein
MAHAAVTAITKRLILATSVGIEDLTLAIANLL